MSNTFRADVFVAVHHNGVDTHDAQGAETIFCSANQNWSQIKNKTLSMMNAFCEKASGNLGIQNRGCLADCVGEVNEGCRAYGPCHFNIPNNVQMPLLYGEASFIDNATEACQILSPLTGSSRIDGEVAAYLETIVNAYDLDCIPVVEGSFVAVPQSGAVNLEWEVYDPTPGDSYRILRSDNCWGPFTLLSTIPYATGELEYSYLDTGVQYSQTYYYILLEVILGGPKHHFASTAPFALPTPSRPSAPSAWASPTPGGDIQVGWWIPPGASSFTVLRTESTPMPECISSASNIDVYEVATTSQNSYLDTGVEEGHLYSYRVQAIGSGGASNLSECITLNATSASGVGAPTAEIGKLGIVSLAGLTRGNVKFDLFIPLSEHVRLDVFDPVGRLIVSLVDRELPTGDISVTWDGLNSVGDRASSGLYIARVQSGGKQAIAKFIYLR